MVIFPGTQFNCSSLQNRLLWVTVCSKKRPWVTGRAQTPIAVEIAQEEVKIEEVKLKPFFLLKTLSKPIEILHFRDRKTKAELKIERLKFPISY